MRTFRAILIPAILCLNILTGCRRAATPVPIPPTPTDRPPTATIAFPTLIPTSTFTPIPTAPPTPQLSSGPGEVVFTDDFSGDLAWTPTELAPGGISLTDERMYISVRQENGSFLAISPSPPLINAYAEVSVRPELCSANDEFGLVFRFNQSFDHYRFTLTCTGEARVVGVVEGVERVLLPNQSFPSIFPGLFLSNQLGVSMENDQFHFFINGEEIFSDRDLALTNGSLGLLVRARQSGQTTASFDNFRILTLEPRATPTTAN